jgi:hypothetical protein
MARTEYVSEAKKVASLITSQGVTDAASIMRGISARVDLGTLARIDSMADKAGKSRNEMINLLLDVGCDAVYENFTQEQIEELQSRESFAFETLLNNKGE